MLPVQSQALVSLTCYLCCLGGGGEHDTYLHVCPCLCVCISAALHVCGYTREPEHNLECHFSPGTPTLFSRDGVCQWSNVHQLRQVSHPGIKPTSDGAGSMYHSARLLELVYLWCLLLLLCVCVSVHVHVSSVPRYWILLELEL